jgi:predicted RNase H-like nuclease
MSKLLVTGFDSAWGGTQRGALCDLWIDKATGKLEINEPPIAVTWSDAVHRLKGYSLQDHHVLAIDQGLVVPNQDGMRPVERLLAKALGAMQCSAYPSNRGNKSCYGPKAGIWSFQRKLGECGYVHKPMFIPGSVIGRFYFECYPHPAIIALLKRTSVLKHKCRHRIQSDWQDLVGYLKSLPVDNLPTIVDTLSEQNKANEDKIDSIVCAYVGFLWWKCGTSESTILGNMAEGYIVTPHSKATLERFKEVFGGYINNDSGTPGVIQEVTNQETESQDGSNAASMSVSLPAMDDGEWSDPVELVATDTTNLSRNMRSAKGRRSIVINDWMDETKLDSHCLVVKFLDEDAEPEVAFVPHSHSKSQKVLMADRRGQPGLWFLLVAGASKQTPLRFRIRYRYEQLI